MTKQASDVKFVTERGGVGNGDADLIAVHGLNSADVVTVADDYKNGALDGRLNLNSFLTSVTGLGTASEDWAPALNAMWAAAIASKKSDLYIPPRSTPRPIRSAVSWATNSSTGSVLEHVRIMGAGLAGSFLVAMTDMTVPAWTVSNLDAVECILTFQGTNGVSTDAWRFIHFSSCRTVKGYCQFFGASSRVAGPSGNGDGALLSFDTCCFDVTVGARGCAVANPSGGVTNDLPSIVRADNWITGSVVRWSQQTDFGVFDPGTGPVDIRKTSLFSGYTMVGLKNPSSTGTTGAPYAGGTVTVEDLRVDEGIGRSVTVRPDVGQRAGTVNVVRPAVNSPSGGNGTTNVPFDFTRCDMVRLTDGRMGLGNGFSLGAVSLTDVAECEIDNLVPLNGPSQTKITTDSLTGKLTVKVRGATNSLDLTGVDPATRLIRDGLGSSLGKTSTLDHWTTASRPVAPMIGDYDEGWNDTRLAKEMYVGGLWVDQATGAILNAPAEIREADDLATADTVAVAAWPDTSGNSLADAVQATGAAKPTMQTTGIGGHKALKFTGGTQWVQTAAYGAAVTQPFSELLVFKSDGTSSAQQTLLDGIVGGTAAGRFDLTATNKFYRINSGSATTSATAIDGNAHIATIVWNATSTILRVDGVQVASGGAGTNGRTGLTLGAEADGTTGFRGLIALYTRRTGAMSTAGLSTWERVYGAKYGITVA